MTQAPLFGREKVGKPENRLEELLLAAATDPGSRPAAYHELLNSELYVIGEVTGNDANLGGGFYIAGEKTSLRARTMVLNGKQVVPIFSSMQRLQEVFPKGVPRDLPYARMKSRILFETLEGATFVLNPASTFGKELVPAEVKSLLDGTIFQKAVEHRIPGGKEFYVRIAENVSEKLVKALTTYLRITNIVERAYLSEIYVPSGGEPPHLLLSIELSPASTRGFRDIVPEIGSIVRDTLGDGQVVDIVDAIDKKTQILRPPDVRPFFSR